MGRPKLEKPANDFTGQIFNYLKVNRVERGKRGFVAICECLKCGKKEHKVSIYDLKRKKFKACGCQSRICNVMHIGERYGYLEITGFDKERRKNGKNTYFVICKCHNCGKESFRTQSGAVKNGRTTSCGCSKNHYIKITGKNSPQFTGYEEIRGGKWSKMKTGASKRGLPFTISIEYVWELYEKQNRRCAISGIPIFFGKWNQETTASLDRINSDLGYIPGNVQWLHKHVNIMKMDYEEKYFFELCKLITEKRMNDGEN